MNEKKSEKDIVKHDRNFMEHPLWFQDQKLTSRKDEQGYVYSWTDDKGYTFTSRYKVPTRKDFLYLMFLMMKAQEKGYPDTITLTRAAIVRGCGFAKNTQEYKRLEEGLERWKFVGIGFAGTFYSGKEYETLSFGVVSSWGIEKKTKRLWVRFNPEWITYQKESRFFELLEFNKIKQLQDPLSTRLYEILKKNLSLRSQWQIDSVKLARKIPMNEGYPAHINPKIKTAVKRISKKIGFQMDLEIKQVERGKTTLVFTLVSAPMHQVPLFPAPENKELVTDLVKHGLTRTQADEVVLKYTEERINANVAHMLSQPDVRNPAAFLLDAFKNDYAGTKPEPKPKQPVIPVFPGMRVKLNDKEYTVKDEGAIFTDKGMIPVGIVRQLINSGQMEVIDG